MIPPANASKPASRKVEPQPVKEQLEAKLQHLADTKDPAAPVTNGDFLWFAYLIYDEFPAWDEAKRSLRKLWLAVYDIEKRIGVASNKNRKKGRKKSGSRRKK